MSSSRATSVASREVVLAMLSAEEKRALASAPSHDFAVGDEYLDLARLGEGVRVARGGNPPFAGLLPRSAVRDATWAKVLRYLEGTITGR